MSCPLSIALTFDAEMDAFDNSIVSEETLAWRGIQDGIPLIETVLSDVQDTSGRPACATWFVRCDDQIGELTGGQAYLLDRFRSIWDRRRRAGDEIAFHPHLYRQHTGKWTQENDPAKLRTQILGAMKAMRDAGFPTQVSRIGEAFCSNAVMEALDESGIRIDSTAMPNRVRKDKDRNIDWHGTPGKPYHPSVGDYRRPGEPARRLAEVPMSMVPTTADYDRQTIMRYLDLSFHPRAIGPDLSSLINASELVVTVTHPSTVVQSDHKHGLLSFSIEAFRENLIMLVSECLRMRRPFRFVTLRDACALMK